MRFIEEPETRPGCFFCGAKEGDGHWSTCPAAPEGQMSDQDPDADNPEQSAEIL